MKLLKRGLGSTGALVCLAGHFLLGAGAAQNPKETIEKRYAETQDGKDPATVLVVVREDLPAGLDAVLFASGQVTVSGSSSQVQVKKDSPRVEVRNGEIVDVKGSREPVTFQTGTLLVTERVRVKKESVEFDLRTLLPAPRQRGLPTDVELFERSKVIFLFDRKTLEQDPAPVFEDIDRWFVPFEKVSDALAFMREQFGPPIKAGMTYADVETLMGPPQRKESEGERVLYYYKDFLVEFAAGMALRYRRIGNPPH